MLKVYSVCFKKESTAQASSTFGEYLCKLPNAHSGEYLCKLPNAHSGNGYSWPLSKIINRKHTYSSRSRRFHPLGRSIPNSKPGGHHSCKENDWWVWFSLPTQLHSDQGRNFKSEVIAEMCRLLHIVKTRTTPYHPQSDGLVERFNSICYLLLQPSTHLIGKLTCNVSVWPITQAFIPRQVTHPFILCSGEKPKCQ